MWRFNVDAFDVERSRKRIAADVFAVNTVSRIAYSVSISVHAVEVAPVVAFFAVVPRVPSVMREN